MIDPTPDKKNQHAGSDEVFIKKQREKNRVYSFLLTPPSEKTTVNPGFTLVCVHLMHVPYKRFPSVAGLTNLYLVID